MEMLLLKRFRCKSGLERLSNELKKTASKDRHFTIFESINLYENLHDKFEIYKQNARGKL